MKIKRLVTVVVLVCFLSGFAACKTLPSIPKGAEDCPIWDTEEGMIWAGIIDGMYPASEVYNYIGINPFSSVRTLGTSDKQKIQSNIAALRKLEPHFVEAIEPDADMTERINLLGSGGVSFHLKKAPEKEAELVFSFVDDVCRLRYRYEGGEKVSYYRLDKNCSTLFDELRDLRIMEGTEY